MSHTKTRRWSTERTIVAGAVILLMLPLLGIPVKTYLTLTIAGLAMGMLLFLIASGVSKLRPWGPVCLGGLCRI